MVLPAAYVPMLVNTPVVWSMPYARMPTPFPQVTYPKCPFGAIAMPKGIAQSTAP